MASQLYPAKAAKAFGIDLKEVNVRFFPIGAGVPNFESEGGVVSVTRVSAGKYLITLNDSYLKLRDAQLTYRDEQDNVDIYPQLGVVSNEGTVNPITIVVKLKTATVNTDVSAGAGAKDRGVYCTFTFEDSTT